jgi:anti-anti-sigma regulatory factor
MTATSALEVYETGRYTRVGFGGREVLTALELADLREDLALLISEHGCRTLAIDFTGVKLLASGLLGLLADLRAMGLTVQVLNAGSEIREVFAVTCLDRLLQLCDAAV